MKATPGLKILLGIVVGSLLATVVTAQEPTDEETGLRRYTVEFVVFRYAEDVGVGTEIFPPEEPLAEAEYPDFGPDEEGPIFTDVPIVAPSEAESASAPWDDLDGEAEAEDQRSQLELILSPTDALSLQDVIDRLERLDVYEPLLYGGWTQVTPPQEQAEPLDLTTFGTPPVGLEGQFTLYLGRYLHLIVDLTLDAGASAALPADDDPALSFRDSRFGFDQDPSRLGGPVLLRIQEDRIMKNGDIRYFDHPKFGVIAKVMRVEPTEQPLQDEDEQAPLVGGFRE